VTDGASPAGWRLQIHDLVGSTSDLCRALALGGEPDGLAVMARRQTAGRGSRGRDWSSVAGNLLFSVLLRPREPAREAGQWSLLAAVALAEALTPLLPDPAALSLKWPNDMLLRGRKLCGILVDSAADSQGELDWLVIGIGVNLTVAPSLPGRPVACLAEETEPPAPEILASAVLERLDHWRGVRSGEGFAPVRAAWLSRTASPGSRVTLRLSGAEISGAFAGLGEDGSLLLDTGARGCAFNTGEVLLGTGGQSDAACD
jgi:BirA family biotin operon repressor/biotin-[acetyl-CoA-carboxylase] ligase